MNHRRIIDALELRAHPELVSELREQPGAHVERRVVPLTAVDTRAADGDTGWRISGLAAVFDARSENLGGFTEVIKRGAFRKVLKTDPDVRCLFNHDMNLPLGRTAAGTLRLRETPEGLEYEADAPDTSYARDLRVLMDRGDVNQSSFAFRVAPGGDSWDEDPGTGALVRTISEFGELYDVSPVTVPAYPQTTSHARSLLSDSPDLEEVRDVAWQIHRGELDATEEDRAVIDGLLSTHSTVSPWVAERTFRAAQVEPELLAAIPGQRTRVEIEPCGGEPAFRLAAMQRRLAARAKQL